MKSVSCSLIPSPATPGSRNAPPAAEQAVAAKASAVVATVAQELLGTDDGPLGDLVADAMRAAGHADFGVMNHGGVRAPLHAGTARYSDVFEVSPFGNVLYKITAKGADMRRYFEKIVSGACAERLGERGQDIVGLDARRWQRFANRLTLARRRRPFDDAATYSVVINDFMLTGGSGLGFPTQPISSEPVNVTDLDALIAYLKSLPQPVTVRPDARIRLKG
jgi:5'-nucleotidase